MLDQPAVFGNIDYEAVNHGTQGFDTASTPVTTLLTCPWLTLTPCPTQLGFNNNKPAE
jgi:hypothetical protein